jgi:hypothetical protein
MPAQPSLAGPRARLDRADTLVAELSTATRAFAAMRPYRVVRVDDPNPLNRRFVVEAVEDVPLPVRVRAGEPGRMIVANGVQPAALFDRNFADDVIFHESGPPSGWPLGHILQNLNKMTRETIEGFADCF